jgi:hypothetical protein
LEASEADESGLHFNVSVADAAGSDRICFDAAAFGANGFEAAGFEATGCEAAGCEAAGFEAAGFEAAGFEATGFVTLAFRAPGLPGELLSELAAGLDDRYDSGLEFGDSTSCSWIIRDGVV